MLTKSQLKGVFLKYGFRPLKRFGENYLIDGNIKDKIIQEAGIKIGDTILEIGPGLGALTMDIAGSADMVYAVEKDKSALAILSEMAGSSFPSLKLVRGDILDFDLRSIFSGKKIKVIGNLPYYITTPIIEYLIGFRDIVESALILVQKEVAQRLLAKPGTKDYASISCFVQYFTKLEYLYTVKRNSFCPVPEVDSSLISLGFSDRPSVKVSDEAVFFKIVRGSFNQRRKSVINSLSRAAVLDMPKDKLEAILSGVGIDPAVRPETLSLNQFAKISNAVSVMS